MALSVKITLVDDYQRRTTKSFEAKATTLSQAATDAAALLADLAAVSLCGADKRSISQVDVLSEAIETGANVDAGGTIHVKLNNGKMHSLKIPAIDPALVNPDGRIDITAPAITDYVANFESAGAFTTSEGNYVTEILYGELDR